jgi:uncharacterized iron-regulated membrane protein
MDGDRIVHLDAGTGEVLADIGFDDYSPMGKFMAAGVPLHQADAGTGNVIANSAFCVALLGLVCASVLAWWKRRPTGGRGLLPPPMPRSLRAWRGVGALMLVASLALPLVAITVAVVVVMDVFVLARIRRSWMHVG